MVLEDDGNGSEISEESDFQQQRAYFTTFGDIPVPCLVDGELDLLESLSGNHLYKYRKTHVF